VANKKQETIFSNDAEIIFVDETTGVTDTTFRPLTGEALKRAQEYVKKREEWRRLRGNLKEGDEEEVVVLDETTGVTDTTFRPLTGAALQRAMEYKKKLEQSEWYMKQMKKAEDEAKPTDIDPK
jgi:hypothetical protein